MPPRLPPFRAVRVWQLNQKLAYSLDEILDALGIDQGDLDVITNSDPDNDDTPLRGVKVGNTWLIPISEIERWLSAHLQVIR